MTANEIRQKFLDFFASKQHQIYPSAPIVVKNDPTLMFTNAGMNQFKPYFLGNEKAPFPRIANAQKCLRVSGKHNDLEEVGVDTYHHTMFEMLGNWSFGDYFKAEALEWSWELLTTVLGIPKERLYVTVFEGDPAENLDFDQESYNIWAKYVQKDHILKGNKKDNFWEMGATGPCGPCSEIHVDLRPKHEQQAVLGSQLVNNDHPQVIEIWNNVFIQYNRKADGSLEQLPAKHVDTGMGFERLVRVLQNKTSNYDTDVFTPYIYEIERITNTKYGTTEKTDIAIRVLSDHIRTIAFTINDGQLPSNTGAGYVIRRILRRGVRYAFSTLQYKQPILCQLVPVFVQQFQHIYPELTKNQDFIQKVIQEEEISFLRTLEQGLRRFAQIQTEPQTIATKIIDGNAAFELYDTFGFPIDLTRLLARENNLQLDEKGFDTAMQQQKERARNATKVEAGDWVELLPTEQTNFVGYNTLSTQSNIIKYREVKEKGKTAFQIVLDTTPFYAESGGQVGDTGQLTTPSGEIIQVLDTKKENNLTVHFVSQLPQNIQTVNAQVFAPLRKNTARNHTATHLLHAALRQVLGTHVQQKGSMVNATQLRFDFSHFSKINDDELKTIETIVNQKVIENIQGNIAYMSKDQAMQMGAMALFGEKYGNEVRVVTFDPNFSVELCGGTHVQATGEIGLIKINTETAVAAGVRRIEAFTGLHAYQTAYNESQLLHHLKNTTKNPKDLLKAIETLVQENDQYRKEIERLQLQEATVIKNKLLNNVLKINNLQIIAQKINAPSTDIVKKIAYDLRREITPNAVIILGAEIQEKAHLCILLDENLPQTHNLDAKKLINTLAPHIEGGGGGQAFFATAGGKKPQGINDALQAGINALK